MRRRPWTFAILITATAAAAMAFADQRLDGSVWQVFHVPAKTIVYFCETTLVDAFLRQPANSYTNLAYLFVAALMLAYTRRAVTDPCTRDGKATFLARFPLYGYIYAACLVYTFLGSTLFHASLGVFPEQVDLGAVYATGAVPLTFGLHSSLEVRGVRPPTRLFLLTFCAWAFASFIFAMYMTAYFVFPGLLLVTGLCIADVEKRNGKPTPWKWLIYLGASVCLAGFFFVADIKRIGCIPDGWMHPHGLWHLAAASAAAAMFGYMYQAK